MARSGGNETTSQTNQTSAITVPTSTLIVAIVLAVLGLLFLVGVVSFGYRAWRRMKDRSKSTASVPVSKKKIEKDAIHMHVDLETASVADEKLDDVDLEKPKRAVLAANSNGISSWHMSVDEKSDDVGAGEQESGWVPQIKASRYGAGILAPKPSFQERTQPVRPPPQGPRTMHYTNPSVSSEILAISPPPSYSAANRLGGLLSRVADVEVIEESRSTDRGTASSPVVPLKNSHSTSSPVPHASSSGPYLHLPAGATPPLPSPIRTVSFMSMDNQGIASRLGLSASVSSNGHLRNNSQSSCGHPSSVSDRGTSELPRLMTVVNTFIPNLEDEVPIKIGDTVRMLEEFRDGWCTVQYVGKFNEAKGVVPRLCLQERKSVLPTQRSSASSLSSTVSVSLRR
ncbi:hypothetical protein AN958_00687 [Leucoagaricus sp. SymC.cos]|nr:hypothetical protein AN958_00687 [Leucoagaricus sp. SymC.cos]